MNIFCSCGGELTAVSVPCMLCEKLICPKCVISSDLDLCSICLKEQNSFIKLKEIENSCDKCNEASQIKKCNCCPIKKVTLKFCEKHHNRCKFCKTLEICQDKSVCTEHVDKCMNCGKYARKRFKCAECTAIYCDTCFAKAFDIFVYRWHKKVICRSHAIVCGRTPTCPGWFYNIENNTCDNLSCQKFCCKVCDCYKKSKNTACYACPDHLKVCLFKGCLNKDVESNMKVLHWKYSNEMVCGKCYKDVKTDINNLLLILNRYGYKFARELIEKIVI